MQGKSKQTGRKTKKAAPARKKAAPARKKAAPARKKAAPARKKAAPAPKKAAPAPKKRGGTTKTGTIGPKKTTQRGANSKPVKRGRPKKTNADEGESEEPARKKRKKPT